MSGLEKLNEKYSIDANIFSFEKLQCDIFQKNLGPDYRKPILLQDKIGDLEAVFRSNKYISPLKTASLWTAPLVPLAIILYCIAKYIEISNEKNLPKIKQKIREEVSKIMHDDIDDRNLIIRLNGREFTKSEELIDAIEQLHDDQAFSLLHLCHQGIGSTANKFGINTTFTLPDQSSENPAYFFEHGSIDSVDIEFAKGIRKAHYTARSIFQDHHHFACVPYQTSVDIDLNKQTIHLELEKAGEIF
ncbi:MAG: hypothetical protein Tsb0015_00760 [Simkaniaceae bacterium]